MTGLRTIINLLLCLFIFTSESLTLSPWSVVTPLCYIKYSHIFSLCTSFSRLTYTKTPERTSDGKNKCLQCDWFHKSKNSSFDRPVIYLYCSRIPKYKIQQISHELATITVILLLLATITIRLNINGGRTIGWDFGRKLERYREFGKSAISSWHYL